MNSQSTDIPVAKTSLADSLKSSNRKPSGKCIRPLRLDINCGAQPDQVEGRGIICRRCAKTKGGQAILDAANDQ